MDTRLNYPEIIRKILTDFAETYTRNGGCRLRILFDDRQKSYMVLHIGWHGNRYIHNAMIHIELIDDRIWIQNDNTEEGIATGLLESGIPKEQIVLGFRHPKVRQYTEFAAA